MLGPSLSGVLNPSSLKAYSGPSLSGVLNPNGLRAYLGPDLIQQFFSVSYRNSHRYVNMPSVLMAIEGPKGHYQPIPA